MALFAGAIADRVPRDRILATVEFTMATTGLLVVALKWSGYLEVWHIFAITVLVGMVRVFQMPSAQALVADTLPQERIANGAAFNTVGMNTGMLIGPLVGGLLFKFYGLEGAYTVVASLYLLSGFATLMIRGVERATPPSRESVFTTVKEGLKYVKSEQVLWATLLLAVIIESSGWTFHTSLIPVFAERVLETDSAGLGWLMFAFGAGAFSGSLGLAMVRNLRHVGKLMILAVVVWHSAILVFANAQPFCICFGDSSGDSQFAWLALDATRFRISLVLLVVIGGGWASTQVFLLSTLLRTTQSAYRGRVISLRALAIYAFALGSMSSGAMAGFWGVPRAATVVGIMGITLVLLLALIAPKLRRL
jgi:predicted MFS family arabinose efflux permease